MPPPVGADVVGADLAGDGEHSPGVCPSGFQKGLIRDDRQRVRHSGKPRHLQKKTIKLLPVVSWENVGGADRFPRRVI